VSNPPAAVIVDGVKLAVTVAAPATDATVTALTEMMAAAATMALAAEFETMRNTHNPQGL